jgi:hypothetical protein
MPQPELAAASREALRRLAMPQAILFGQRLLARSRDGMIHFREFVEVAREFQRDRPEETAQYLAVLIALEMGRPDPEIDPAVRPPTQPSHN